MYIINSFCGHYYIGSPYSSPLFYFKSFAILRNREAAFPELHDWLCFAPFKHARATFLTSPPENPKPKSKNIFFDLN